MVQIPGRVGKSSGMPLSTEKEFEQEIYVTRSEMAGFIRELASAIEAGGRVEVTRDDWTLGVNPMEPLKIEIQYKGNKRELEIQLKLKESP